MKGSLVTQSPTTPLPSPKQRRHLREAASLTQAQVAERVGVSRETVRAWESGRTTPRGRRREAYAELLASLAEAGKVTNTQVTASAPQVTVCPDKHRDPPRTVSPGPPAPAPVPMNVPAPVPVAVAVSASETTETSGTTENTRTETAPGTATVTPRQPDSHHKSRSHHKGTPGKP